MSEPIEAPAKGRPRPAATIERDGTVLKWLTENPGKTRAEIAAGTSIAGNEVYLSLYRLSRADPPAIVKSGAKWSVAGAAEHTPEHAAA